MPIDFGGGGGGGHPDASGGAGGSGVGSGAGYNYIPPSTAVCVRTGEGMPAARARGGGGGNGGGGGGGGGGCGAVPAAQWPSWATAIVEVPTLEGADSDSDDGGADAGDSSSGGGPSLRQPAPAFVRRHPKGKVAKAVPEVRFGPGHLPALLWRCPRTVELEAWMEGLAVVGGGGGGVDGIPRDS
jgi:hypothetical protein